MSQTSSEQPTSVREPMARGPVAPRFHDWRGRDVDARIASARREARSAVGVAVSHPASSRGGARAWAEAELRVQRCIAAAIERVPTSPDNGEVTLEVIARRDPVCADLLEAALLAPDTRSRYVFAEDLLAHVTGASEVGE